MAPDEIRALREQLGLGRAEFAARLGVTPRLVGYWETGGRSPGGAAEILLRKLAKTRARRKGTGDEGV
jgi:DNA-binding transcriptional regulator YiaG